MKRVTAMLVPKLLNFEQKQYGISWYYEELLNDVNNDTGLLIRVITGDETWVYGYDVETKAQFQWMLPDEPRPKKARQL